MEKFPTDNDNHNNANWPNPSADDAEQAAIATEQLQNQLTDNIDTDPGKTAELPAISDNGNIDDAAIDNSANKHTHRGARAIFIGAAAVLLASTVAVAMPSITASAHNDTATENNANTNNQSDSAPSHDTSNTDNTSKQDSSQNDENATDSESSDATSSDTSSSDSNTQDTDSWPDTEGQALDEQSDNSDESYNQQSGDTGIEGSDGSSDGTAVDEGSTYKDPEYTPDYDSVANLDGKDKSLTNDEVAKAMGYRTMEEATDNNATYVSTLMNDWMTNSGYTQYGDAFAAVDKNGKAFARVGMTYDKDDSHIIDLYIVTTPDGKFKLNYVDALDTNMQYTEESNEITCLEDILNRTDEIFSKMTNQHLY